MLPVALFFECPTPYAAVGLATAPRAAEEDFGQRAIYKGFLGSGLWSPDDVIGNGCLPSVGGVDFVSLFQAVADAGVLAYLPAPYSFSHSSSLKGSLLILASFAVSSFLSTSPKSRAMMLEFSSSAAAPANF